MHQRKHNLIIMSNLIYIETLGYHGSYGSQGRSATDPNCICGTTWVVLTCVVVFFRYCITWHFSNHVILISLEQLQRYVLHIQGHPKTVLVIFWHWRTTTCHLRWRTVTTRTCSTEHRKKGKNKCKESHIYIITIDRGM